MQYNLVNICRGDEPDIASFVLSDLLTFLQVLKTSYRALREVERLTRNPEKLANADGRCWKDTLERKRSFKTQRPPYPTRRGLVTAWQETKKLLHDESGRTMSGRT